MVMSGPGKISDEQLSEGAKQVEREFAANDNAAPSAVKPLDAQPSHPEEPSPHLLSLVFRRLLDLARLKLPILFASVAFSLGESTKRAAYMARAITIEELEAARNRYAEEIRKLEEMGPNPQFRITAAQISRLIETLEVLRDQCTAMISSYGSAKKS